MDQVRLQRLRSFIEEIQSIHPSPRYVHKNSLLHISYFIEKNCSTELKEKYLSLFYEDGDIEPSKVTAFLKLVEVEIENDSLTNTELVEVQATMPTPISARPSVSATNAKVFIVHGHDDGTKHAVARFIQKLGLNPVILHEKPNQGAAIIEKFEANADVGFAIVLLTPDDTGGAKSSPGSLKDRARQNVILELGYFIGRLGRNRVAALNKGVEIPSDMSGVVYIPMAGEDDWHLALAKELKSAGYAIDMNLVV